MASRAESSVEQRIRDAQKRGAVNNLAGSGKPLPDLDEPLDEMWWIRKWLKRENLAVTPQTLSLRKQVDIARESIAAAQSEQEVRDIIADINPKISEANRRASSGPPTNLMPFNVERAVAKWRAARSG